jgi:hypothetical protein
LHYHALLKYQSVPAPEAVEALWKSNAGDAQVEVYGSGGGAAWYLAKMFPYEDTHYDLGGCSISLDRRNPAGRGFSE